MYFNPGKQSHKVDLALATRINTSTFGTHAVIVTGNKMTMALCKFHVTIRTG